MSQGKKTIEGSFIYENGMLDFKTTTKEVTFEELKEALIKLKEEIDRLISNEHNCPFNNNNTLKNS